MSRPRGLDDVARQLATLLAPADDPPAIAPLREGTKPRRVVAIDGSSVTLAESGDHLIAAYRAASVALEDANTASMQAPEPRVALLTPTNATALLARRLEDAGIPGHALPRMDPGGALDALRTLDELLLAERALAQMREHDLLLLDGALQARAHLPITDRIVAAANARGVDVVGVCKSTGITLQGIPALVACQLAARRARHATWIAALPTPPHVRGKTYAARLNPAETRAFRFDVSTKADPTDVLAGLATLCGHPAYPGYPSPLAMAHNAATINDDQRRRLRHDVHEAALTHGVDPHAWDAAFHDYHDILELGA